MGPGASLFPLGGGGYTDWICSCNLNRMLDAIGYYDSSVVPIRDGKFLFAVAKKQGHSTFLIDLGGGAHGGITEWCRRN